LTDTLQGTNGLLTAAREPKADPARIEAVTEEYTPAMPAEAVARLRTAAEQRTRRGAAACDDDGEVG
jgi:hypothetical protein